MHEIKTPKIEQWNVADIIPYDLNVKKHDKQQVARIVSAILKSGKFDVPIVVDKYGVIIKGHGRRLAAIEIGMKTVPVICHRDLNPEEVRAMRLADNRVAISDIDTDMLKIELGDLDVSMLDDIFDAKELDFVTADLGVVNNDAFVSDMDVVLQDQRTDMESRVESAKTERVQLSKAFGFRDIAATAQIHISRLMAKAEAATGLQGDEALGSYLATL